VLPICVSAARFVPTFIYYRLRVMLIKDTPVLGMQEYLGARGL